MVTVKEAITTHTAMTIMWCSKTPQLSILFDPNSHFLNFFFLIYFTFGSASDKLLQVGQEGWIIVWLVPLLLPDHQISPVNIPLHSSFSMRLQHIMVLHNNLPYSLCVLQRMWISWPWWFPDSRETAVAWPSAWDARLVCIQPIRGFISRNILPPKSTTTTEIRSYAFVI